MFGQRDPLDALLDSALDQEARRKVKKLPTIKIEREAQIKEAFREVYLNPENWLPGKHLMVIHRAVSGEHTILGAFQRLTHVHRRLLSTGKILSRPTGAEKLLRCEGPILVEDQLFVTGDHWLHGFSPVQPPSFPPNFEGIEDHNLTFNLMLVDLGVHADNVRIQVRTERGWTRRVTLVETTQFFCPTNKVIVFLPKGIDVLEAMSFENKVQLKEKLRK